jgi:hypothetical protein
LPVTELLRLVDPDTGRLVPTRLETAEAQRQRAEDLAAEVERLRQLLKAQRPANGR